MREDPIVAEIHRIRQQIMARFNGDLEAYVAYLQSREESDLARGFRYASLPRVKPKTYGTDAA